MKIVKKLKTTFIFGKKILENLTIVGGGGKYGVKDM